jgi:hypothetical protein
MNATGYNKKNITLAETVIWLAVLNAVLLFFCGFVFYSIDKTKIYALESKRQTVSYEQRIKSAKEIQTVLMETAVARSDFQSVFLSEEQIINFIKELEFLAKKTDVALIMKGVNMGTAKSKDPVLSLELKGSFSDLFNFFVLLENDKYRSVLRSSYLHKLTEGDGWQAALEVELLSFYEKN